MLRVEKYTDRLFHLSRIAQMPMSQAMEGTLLAGEGVEREYTLHHP
jgi:hypothetical protein